MTPILVLAPGGADVSLTEPVFYERLEEARAHSAKPFDPTRTALVSGVAEALLKGGTAALAPFVTHFAFWIRAAALNKLAQNFAGRLPPQTRARARGLAFHLPPQNVETVFLYSWVLSYLVGNANVVRLPLEVSPDMRRVCDLFLRALEAAGDRSQLFVHYPSRSEVGTEISRRSDARVLWGGDAKIAAFAGVPLRNGGKSIWFGDRFSFGVMSGAALAALDRAGRASLAQKFFNDVYVFDQMACSSPHAIYVTGERDRHGEAVEAFLDELTRVARERDGAPATGHAIRKMVEAFAAVASGDAVATRWADSELTTVVAARPERREQRVGGGYLRITFIDSLAAVPGLVREHDQTITHFGFSREEISAAADSLTGFGVSRWAPVGAALDFDFVWDGYDLPFELTRLVRVG